MACFQVTLGVGATEVVVPAAMQTTLMVQWLTFQNNSAHAVRYGNDKTVSVTTPAAVNGGTAGKGILLSPGSPGGAGSQSTPITYGTSLRDWWIAGTPGDVIDVLTIG